MNQSRVEGDEIHETEINTFVPRPSVNQSRVEGEGLREAIVGLETQFVLTTRNAEGEQYYDESERVTVEIRNLQGRGYAVEARVQDNKETGQCNVSVKGNEKHLHGSPFAVQVIPRLFRLVFFQLRTCHGDQARVSKPWGVTVNERDEIAVTVSGHNIVQQVDRNGNLQPRFGGKGNKQGDFDCLSYRDSF